MSFPETKHLERVGAQRILRATRDVLAWKEQGQWKEHRRFLIPEGTIVGDLYRDRKGVQRLVLFSGLEVLDVGVKNLEGFEVEEW